MRKAYKTRNLVVPKKSAAEKIEQAPRNRVFCGDCAAGMAKLPAACIDAIVTDPPFAIEFAAKRANYNRAADRVLEGYAEVSRPDYAAFCAAWMRQARRVIKPTGSVFVFSGWNNLKDILAAAADAGFVTVNHLIWKYQFGVFCKRRFVSSHYHCLFLCADDKKRKFNTHARHAAGARLPGGGSALYADLEDVWNIKREYWRGSAKTPTKLPYALAQKILQYVTDEGDLVLDPFLGSGQVAVVAKDMRRDYLGYEIAPQYAAFARSRLKQNAYRLPPQKAAKKPYLM